MKFIINYLVKMESIFKCIDEYAKIEAMQEKLFDYPHFISIISIRVKLNIYNNFH